MFNRKPNGLPVPSEAEARQAFAEALPERPRQLLAALTLAGVVKPSYYPELLTHRPIMWLVAPSLLHTLRYYPEEWAQLVADADALVDTDLWGWYGWRKLPAKRGH